MADDHPDSNHAADAIGAPPKDEYSAPETQPLQKPHPAPQSPQLPHPHADGSAQASKQAPAHTATPTHSQAQRSVQIADSQGSSMQLTRRSRSESSIHQPPPVHTTGYASFVVALVCWDEKQIHASSQFESSSSPLLEVHAPIRWGRPRRVLSPDQQYI